jgi:N-acetylmuramic acid 6-phosphate etherase
VRSDVKRSTTSLGTEDRSDATRDIDRISVTAGLALLSHEFRRPFDAFEASAVELAPVVDAVVDCIRQGGVIHLFGAGTSGRMAALDAAEIPPTFGYPSTVFRPHLAGGASAMSTAVEDAEDDADDGARTGAELDPGDVAIGVTASGRTPFVLAALAAARERGAFTALIDCNRHNTQVADCHVTLHTGPEPIAGSTRLNAATAQKLALNAISTLAMVHLGRTYSNLMVCLQPNNSKLRKRLARTLRDISGASSVQVKAALASADNDGSIALAMLMRGWDVQQARSALDRGTLLRPIVDGDEAGSRLDADASP